MKAHLPYEYDHSARGKRKQAVASAMMLFARAIYESGGRPNEINRWISSLNESTCEVGGYSGSGFSNKTWQDEILFWGEKRHLILPKAYILRIDGELTASGDEKKLLVLLELYALSKIGYGNTRLHRVFDRYAEISGMFKDGHAVYTKHDLEAWCEKKGICCK